MQKEPLFKSVIGQVTNFFLNNAQRLKALLSDEFTRPEVFLNVQATHVLENYIDLETPPKDHKRQLQFATAEMYDWYMRSLGEIRQAKSEHDSLMSAGSVVVQRDTETGKMLRQIIRKRIREKLAYKESALAAGSRE